MNKTDRVYVAGHRGLVGSAILRNLRKRHYENVVTRDRVDLDLTDQQAVRTFFRDEKPDYVFLAAAQVGGIQANSSRAAEFILNNLLIQTNVIDAAYRSGAAKLTFLGSSCIYPKLAPQPMKEEYLLTGPLEPTNQWYAVAKIAGIKMCQAYARQYGFNTISLMPTNLYGPGDNFDLETSHVLPALMRKIHEAKESGSREIVIWGSGTPRREFLHVDDLADAAVFLTETYDDPQIVNIGVGKDISILELAELISRVVGFSGEIVRDTSKPDGAPRKLLDIDKVTRLGWTPKIRLSAGIEATYREYVKTTQ
jgi:GDP-L-fucose synthase